MRAAGLSTLFPRRGGLPAALLLIATLGLPGCAEVPMRDGATPLFVEQPYPDLATVVFLRPSNFAFRIPAAVYDITDERSTLIGLLGPDKRVAVAVPPGPHRFMVVTEAADFMEAELEGGRTYYALVAPRLGLRRARFSLQPLPATAPELNAYLRGTSWVENTQASLDWSQERREEIQAKKDEALPEWRDDPGRAKLQ